ncbi:MAG: ATP-binding protein [Thermodesulfobacteriota bacterium]|nr:ATP-binding protein [Thermodesulfobacteriota bacterium]
MGIAAHVEERIEQKKTDYTHYGFTSVESQALKTYFDLAQEFERLEDIYQVSVAIPKLYFDLEARLYLMDLEKKRLCLVAKTDEGEGEIGGPPPTEIKPAQGAYRVNRSMILTIRGNRQFVEQFPFGPEKDLIGILEVYPVEEQNTHQELFFEKYANRIGFSLHIRSLLRKNMEHLEFIQGLVADIEHNVIVPNMLYRLFLRRLSGKIQKNREIEKLLKSFPLGDTPLCKKELEPILAELAEVNRGLTEEFRSIKKHYHSTSLFLETLLRRSHFDEGRLTLRTKACNMKKAVVQPQLERFEERFAERGIAIDDKYSGIPDEETISVVDIGLMAQVYANLFSNALKYTHEITNDAGEQKKYIAYGREFMKDYFGPGKDGIKYNVFSTGLHIAPEERERIFEVGYRGSNASNRPGTGHGLAFVRNAVEIHGGVAGYEASPSGNNFYFILPVRH